MPKNGLVQGKGVEPNNSRSRLAHKWPVPVGSLVASLVVGTILTLANHGDRLFIRDITPSLIWIIAINYAVSLVLVLTSGRCMDWGGETASGSDARSAHGEPKLGGR